MARSLDSWITGNYGEDHPANQQNWYADEADRIARSHREVEDRKLWVARHPWTSTNDCETCDGTGEIHHDEKWMGSHGGRFIVTVADECPTCHGTGQAEEGE